MTNNQLVYIETFGCSANQNNSEIIAGLLTQSGYQITNNKDIADTVILNTCVVKNTTENKIKRKIQDLSKEDKLTIVTGCMPDSDSKSITKLNPRALQLSSHNIKSVVQLISHQSLPIINNQAHEEKILLPKIPLNKLVSITQILEGCLSSCTFCKTKLAKGNVFSYPQDKIIKSIESDLKNGAKEVWLTSQGNACYGMDRGKQELPELVKKILQLPFRFKLRVGMMNPHHLYPILDDMIEVYKDKKVYKFLHLPIQSASNKVLKSMRRPYKIEKVEEMIKKFKGNFSDMIISTDIIVGYPTENEEDHQMNVDFLKRHRLSVTNLSKFSKHKGTSAENLEELPISILNQRNKELMNLLRQIAFENKEKYLGKTIKVFVNKKINSIYEGRDENYNIILMSSENSILGKNVDVNINKRGVFHLLGKIVN